MAPGQPPAPAARSSRTTGHREPTRIQALVRSSRRPPGKRASPFEHRSPVTVSGEPRTVMRRKASRWTPSRSHVSTAGSSRSGRPGSPRTSRPVGTCTMTTRCGGSRSPGTGRRRTRDQGGLVTGPTRHEATRARRLVQCCSTQEPVPDRIDRSAAPRRCVPIRPVSERKAALSTAANTARGLVRDRDGCCILCGSPGVDAHHRLPRGGGGAIRDPSGFALSWLVWLCRECHCWAESRRTLGSGPWSAGPSWHHPLHRLITRRAFVHRR